MSLVKIYERRPLVHCMTNVVVTNFTANGLLAVGASPIMADEKKEMQDIVSIADSLLLNIGTINDRTKESMLEAVKWANDKGIPIILDPVGVGASSYRMLATMELLEKFDIHLIRCNQGELATIANVDWEMNGVDSGTGAMNIEEIAKKVATNFNTIVVVTGAVDYITDGNECVAVPGGHERITRVTGSGCLLSALCAALMTTTRHPISDLSILLQQYKQLATTLTDDNLYSAFLSTLNRLARGIVQ